KIFQDTPWHDGRRRNAESEPALARRHTSSPSPGVLIGPARVPQAQPLRLRPSEVSGSPAIATLGPPRAHTPVVAEPATRATTLFSATVAPPLVIAHPALADASDATS